PPLLSYSPRLQSTLFSCTAPPPSHTYTLSLHDALPISYYNDSERNWNERPYFTKVEEKRGRIGCHIDVGKQEQPYFELDSHDFAATPSSSRKPSSESERKYVECLLSQGNRVVLSGIGGDEVMGGVPTPTPELQDLLVEGHFKQLAHQLKVWALNKR